MLNTPHELLFNAIALEMVRPKRNITGWKPIQFRRLLWPFAHHKMNQNALAMFTKVGDELLSRSQKEWDTFTPEDYGIIIHSFAELRFVHEGLFNKMIHEMMMDKTESNGNNSIH